MAIQYTYILPYLDDGIIIYVPSTLSQSHQIVQANSASFANFLQIYGWCISCFLPNITNLCKICSTLVNWFHIIVKNEVYTGT